MASLFIVEKGWKWKGTIKKLDYLKLEPKQVNEKCDLLSYFGTS